VRDIMDANQFIEVFMEIFKVIASVAIIFFCGLVLLMTHKLDKDLLRARLFLKDTMMWRTWICISIAGASFAFNVLFNFANSFNAIGDLLSGYYIVELNQFIFLTAFVYAVHSWYLFISMHRQINAGILTNEKMRNIS